MRYKTPNYEKELIETSDVILASDGIVDLGDGVTLVDVGDGNAQVGASAYDVLGIR